MKPLLNRRAMSLLCIAVSTGVLPAVAQSQELSQSTSKSPLTADWAAKPDEKKSQVTGDTTLDTMPELADIPASPSPAPSTSKIQPKTQGANLLPPILIVPITSNQGSKERILVIRQNLGLKSILESLILDQKEQAVFDDHFPDVECTPHAYVGTVDEILFKLTSLLSTKFTWGHMGNQWVFVPVLPQLVPAVIAPPSNEFARPEANPAPNVPPGADTFEFNGNRVYHVPLAPSAPGGQDVPLRGVSPQKEGDSASEPQFRFQSIVEVPPAQNPMSQLPVVIRADGEVYSWGRIAPIPDKPNALRVTIQALVPIEQFVREVAKLEGCDVLFDPLIARASLASGVWEGTPDAIIEHLGRLLSASMAVGRTGKTRLFVPRRDTLRTLTTRKKTDDFNPYADQYSRKVPPGTPYFEFNGMKVYNLPLRPSS